MDFSGQCIVNAANTGMLGGGGVDRAISNAGGHVLYQLREQIPLLPGSDYKRCEVGDARLTLSGKAQNDLRCDYVIHAVGPNYGFNTDPVVVQNNDRLLYNAYSRCMQLAKTHDIQTIAFCLISASIFRGAQSLQSVLQIGLRAIKEHISEGQHVFIVGFTSKELQTLAQCSLDLYGEPDSIYRQIDGVSYSDNSETDDEDSESPEDALSQKDREVRRSERTSTSMNWSLNDGMHDDEDKENRHRLARNVLRDESSSVDSPNFENKSKLNGMNSGTPSVTQSPSIPCSDFSTESPESEYRSDDCDCDLNHNHSHNHNGNAMNHIPFDFEAEIENDRNDPTEESITFETHRVRWNLNVVESDEFDEFQPNTNQLENDEFPLVHNQQIETIDAQSQSVITNQNEDDTKEQEQRIIFRKYVIDKLERNRERTRSISFVFGLLFGIWIMVNVFVFTFYDTLSLCIGGVVMVLFLNGCDGDGAFMMLFVASYLVKKGIQSVMEKGNGLESWHFDDKMIVDAALFGLLTVMLYLFLWDNEGDNGCNVHLLAAQEHVFNNGVMRRAMSFMLYFGINGFLAMDLIADWSAMSVLDMFALFVFLLFCGAIWIRLQDVEMIQVSQHRLTEISAFLAVMAAMSAVFMVQTESRVVRGNLFDENYMLLTVTTLSSLGKLYEL